MTRRFGVAALAAVLLVAAACGTDAGEPSGRPPSTSSATRTASASASSPAPAVPTLKLTPIATAAALTAATTRKGDSDLYLTEQAGRVRRLRIGGDNGNGVLDDAPVLDITNLVTAGGEQGLLGITFSPDGGDLYVAFTNKEQNQELDRFPFNGTTADATKRTTILTIPDFAPNHNGGQLTFGPDGYLWWGMGDGGGGGDPQGNGQKTTDLLGDILRIDIDPAHATGNKPYSAPKDNPFADGKNGAPEVWDYGLRNPWRFSFDPANGDLWIADVGQNQWEEIDKVPSTKGGLNFGWSQLEGTHPFNGGTKPAGAIDPIYEYDHSGGRCAVVGGYVYRGKDIAGLDGTYTFSDNCDGVLHGLRVGNDGSVSVFDLGLTVAGASSFAVDPQGRLYVLSVDGTIARIDQA